MIWLYDKNISSATRHFVCAALKFYYEVVSKRNAEEAAKKIMWTTYHHFKKQHDMLNCLFYSIKE